MFNTISNISRKADKYGDVHFVSFLASTLSRLAYFDDNHFLKKYNAIMGPVISPQILQGINNVPASNLAELLNDQKIFGLDKGANDIFKNHEYIYKEKNYIDFLALNMPQNVNIINGDLEGIVNSPIPGTPAPPGSVKYISIGWSNYGEVYVVADKRMPNTVYLIFRGTYSAKTAALYSKPTSVVPVKVCKDNNGNPESFLYGIFKPSSEMIHTIIEAMRSLAVDFLGATTPNSVKIFTTGHSLGGAMCSNFAYLWMGIKKTAPYNAAPYNVLADNIVCISLGAPRCMSSSVAKKFCNFASQKKILFLRITTRGDPVPGLPPKTGFQHPCSDDNKMRMEISEDCNSQLTMRPTPNVNYKGDLDCQNYKTRVYAPNPLSHTIYLDILYIKAVDIVKFAKGMGIAQEVSRGPNGSTMCRVIMGENNENPQTKEFSYKVVFFDVNKARETPTDIDAKQAAELATAPGPVTGGSRKLVGGFGGPVAEDRRMTMTAFNALLGAMVPLSGNLCPQSAPQPIALANPFNNQLAPDLSCPGAVGGGRKKTNKTNKTNKTKKTHKTKKTLMSRRKKRCSTRYTKRK